jgi:N6-adenosine-specific RNA methylase IME4
MAGPLCGREGFADSGGPSRALPYPSMTLDQIKAMRVVDVADAHSHLYLWTTNGYLRDAFDVAAAWGFKYSTTLVWAKAPMGGGLGGAFGICTEYLLYCRRGSLQHRKKIGRTWFDFKRPYDLRGKPNHSGKPEEFYGVIEQVSPGAYLELFARQNRLGWNSWGNECLSVDLPALAA